MFIDDLVRKLKEKGLGVSCGNNCNVTSLLYADDIVVTATSEQNLQSLIDTVSEWCDDWKMKLNTSKTKIIHFRRNLKNKPRSSFHFENIEYVSQYKYLGLVLNEHLDWAPALKNGFCVLCSSGDVGDEVHFLTLYPALAHLRSKLFEAISALDQKKKSSISVPPHQRRVKLSIGYTLKGAIS